VKHTSILPASARRKPYGCPNPDKPQTPSLDPSSPAPNSDHPKQRTRHQSGPPELLCRFPDPAADGASTTPSGGSDIAQRSHRNH